MRILSVGSRVVVAELTKVNLASADRDPSSFILSREYFLIACLVS